MKPAVLQGGLDSVAAFLPKNNTVNQVLEKAVAPHSSTPAWKIPWTEEPGGLQSMGSLEVGHDWATSLSLFTLMHWRRKWQPTPVFLPGESQGRGSLVGCHLWGCRVGHDWSDLAAAATKGCLDAVSSRPTKLHTEGNPHMNKEDCRIHQLGTLTSIWETKLSEKPEPEGRPPRNQDAAWPVLPTDVGPQNRFTPLTRSYDKVKDHSWGLHGKALSYTLYLTDL